MSTQWSCQTASKDFLLAWSHIQVLLSVRGSHKNICHKQGQKNEGFFLNPALEYTVTTTLRQRYKDFSKLCVHFCYKVMSLEISWTHMHAVGHFSSVMQICKPLCQWLCFFTCSMNELQGMWKSSWEWQRLRLPISHALKS